MLTIGAAEFRPRTASDTYIDADGYLYNAVGDLDYWASASLPEGALVEKICLYANDSDPANSLLAYIFVAKLVPGGEGPLLQMVGLEAGSTSNTGYEVYCSAPFSHTVRGRMNDGDGTPDPVAYYVYALVPEASQNSLGFGGVQISWRRQVSPPPPGPTFGDVPASDGAFTYIEALVASGITAGCGGNNFCPGANLTRRQMAVFLAKALGLHWAN